MPKSSAEIDEALLNVECHDPTCAIPDIHFKAKKDLHALINRLIKEARIDELNKTCDATDDKKWQQAYSGKFEVELYRIDRLKSLENE